MFYDFSVNPRLINFKVMKKFGRRKDGRFYPKISRKARTVPMSNATFNSLRENDTHKRWLNTMRPRRLNEDKEGERIWNMLTESERAALLKKVRQKPINNHTHIHTHMQQVKKLTVENVSRKDLLEKAFSLPSGWFVEVYVEDDGRVVFSSPMTGNSWTEDPHKVGRIEAMTFGDVEGMYLRSDGRVEIDVEQLGESGKRKVQKGEHYDRVEILAKTEALDLIDDIASNNDWDVNGLLSEVDRVGTVRTWARKNKGKFVHNSGAAGLTLISAKEAEKIDYENSDKIEDYAENLINTNDSLPSELE